MKLAGLLQRERSTVAVTQTITFNAPGIYYPPYGRSVFVLSGQGTPGNATVPGNVSGTNTYNYSTYVPASGGNVAAYYPATGGNVSGNNSYTYTNTEYQPPYPVFAYNQPAVYYYYGGEAYAGTNPGSGGNYAGVNAATPGNVSGTNPASPGNPAGILYTKYQFYYVTDSFGFYSGSFTQRNQQAANLPAPTHYYLYYGSYYDVTENFTSTGVYYNPGTPGNSNYNPPTPGNPYYNPYTPGNAYNAPYYVAVNYSYAVYNTAPGYYYTVTQYVPGNPNYNPYYPAYSNYNTYYPAYTYNTTVPGNPNYNPTVSGNAGSTYNVLGITLPGGNSDSSAPVIGYSTIGIDYTTAGIPISVPPGGYVVIQNKYPGT